MSDHAVILLVDDLEDDRLLVRRAFEKAAVSNPLHCVSSGEEAIQYLGGTGPYANRAEHPLPDLILLDLKMPGMDGFEVLVWLRQQPGFRSIPVVVLTSSDLIKDVNRAYALGANSFLVKPLDFQNYTELGKVINEYWLRKVKTPETFRPPPRPDSRRSNN
jgi:CheY-like chemotaxis protein